MIPTRLWLFILSALAAGCAELEPTPAPVQRDPPVLRAAPQFKAIEGTDGLMRETMLHTTPLPDAGARLELRTIVVQPQRTVLFVPSHEVVLEVRSGEFELARKGNRITLRPGDQWLVTRDEPSELRVLGQLGVLRAIYLVRE